MKPLIRVVMPSRERLARTVFWTFWGTTVALTLYAWGVSSFGIGMFLDDAYWVPKLHMRAEVRVAECLSLVSLVGLFLASMFIERCSRPQLLLVAATIGLWFLYLAIPRF
jgi:hypothetical protein